MNSVEDAIATEIGHYVMTFASVELVIVFLTAKLLEGRNWSPTIFLSKTMPADTKQDNLRRAVKEKKPRDADTILAALNAFRDCIKRRNDIVHGSYAKFMVGNSPADYVLRLGRVQSVSSFPTFEELTVDSLRADRAELERICQIFNLALAAAD